MSSSSSALRLHYLYIRIYVYKLGRGHIQNLIAHKEQNLQFINIYKCFDIKFKLHTHIFVLHICDCVCVFVWCYNKMQIIHIRERQGKRGEINKCVCFKNMSLINLVRQPHSENVLSKLVCAARDADLNYIIYRFFCFFNLEYNTRRI